jgi:ornithine--oxo-acid transaminase
MIGLDFDKPSGLRARASWSMLQRARIGLFSQLITIALFRDHRMLTQVSGDFMEVIKLIPPLMISDDDVKAFTEALDEVLEDVSKGGGLNRETAATLIKMGGRTATSAIRPARSRQGK